MVRCSVSFPNITYRRAAFLIMRRQEQAQLHLLFKFIKQKCPMQLRTSSSSP